MPILMPTKSEPIPQADPQDTEQVTVQPTEQVPQLPTGPRLIRDGEKSIYTYKPPSQLP